MTHAGNRTEDGVRIIIHAEGVLVQQKGQALSSTPEACGVIFHHPRRRRVSRALIWWLLPGGSLACDLLAQMLKVVRADTQVRDFLDHWNEVSQ